MLWYKLVDIKLNKTKQLFDEIDLLEQELETDINLFKNLLNEDLNNNKLKLLIQKICIKKCIQNSIFKDKGEKDHGRQAGKESERIRKKDGI